MIAPACKMQIFRFAAKVAAGRFFLVAELRRVDPCTAKTPPRLAGIRKTVKPTYGYDHRSVFM